MGYVIGIDVGSQSVKAVLMDADGAEVAHTWTSQRTTYPASGWAEQDPVAWERAVAECVRGLRGLTGIGRGEVDVLALACQVDGLVALGAQLRPLRPAMIWLDRRATRESRLLSDAVGEDALVARTGLNPDASHTAPKAMWLREKEPETYRATRWLTSVAGHLNGWLTGEVVHDHANASSTLLYDLASRAWCDELIGHAGLDAMRLPRIRPATSVIGPLRPEAAEELGLSPSCLVAAGTGDDHAAALGAGALCPGVTVDVTGTAEPVAVASWEPVFDDERLLETHAHAVEDMLLIQNPGFVSGGSTSWWARTHGVTQGEMFALADRAPAGSGGALFLPALSGAMAPRWNERMRGCFAGLGLHHGATHMARAVLEGCSYALRDIVDRFASLGLGGEELRVVGGGARSPLWLQIKADVTGRPVRRVEGDYATSAGAAMLAGVAAGNFCDLHDAAARAVRLAVEPIVPQPVNAETYEEAYGAYRRLFDGMEAVLV
jgi:xylulokinase